MVMESVNSCLGRGESVQNRIHRIDRQNKHRKPQVDISFLIVKATCKSENAQNNNNRTPAAIIGQNGGEHSSGQT